MNPIKQLLVVVAGLLTSAASHALDIRFYSVVYGAPEEVTPGFGIALECKSPAGLEVAASNAMQLGARLREELVFRDVPLGSRCRYQHIVPSAPPLGSGRGAQFRPAAGLWNEVVAEPRFAGGADLSIPVVHHFYKTQDYSVYGGVASVVESLPTLRLETQIKCTTPAFEFPLLPFVPSVSVEFSRIYSLPFSELLHDVPVNATCTLQVDRSEVESQLKNTDLTLGLIESRSGGLTVAVNPKKFSLSNAEILVTSNAISPAAAADVYVNCDLGAGIPGYEKKFLATLLGTTIRLNDVPVPSRCSVSTVTYALAPEGFIYLRNAYTDFKPNALSTPTRATILIEALPARRISLTSATEGGSPGNMQFFLHIGCKFSHTRAGEVEFSSLVSGATEGLLLSAQSIPIGAVCESSRLTYGSIPPGYIPLFPTFQNRTFAFDSYAADVLPKFTVTAGDPLQFALTHRLAKAEAQIRVRWEALPGSANVAYDPKIYSDAYCRTLQLLPGNFMTSPRALYLDDNKADWVIDGAVVGETCEINAIGTALPPGYAWAPRGHKFELPITRVLQEVTVRSLLYSHASASVEFRVVGKNIPTRYSGSAELRCEKFGQIVFSKDLSFYDDRLMGNHEAVPHNARCGLVNLRVFDLATSTALTIEKPVNVFNSPASGADWNMLFTIEAAAFGAEDSARAVPTLSLTGLVLLIAMLSLTFMSSVSNSKSILGSNDS